MLPAPIQPMKRVGDEQAKRVLKTQAVFGLLMVAGALPFGGPAALSACVGAGTCLLANLLFVVWVFQGYRAQEPERLLLRIYGAEIVKIGLILGSFVIAFLAIDELNLPILLGAYLIVQVAAPMIAAQWVRPPSSGADT